MTTDLQILEMLRSGNLQDENKAIREMYQRNLSRIQSYTERNSGNAHDAEELLQDAIVVLVKNSRKEEFKLTAKIDTYLYSVVRNLWYKHLRKLSSKATHVDVDSEFIQLEVPPQDVSFGNERSPMYYAILKLGEVCQNILRMYYFEEKGIPVIMERLEYKNEQVVRNKKSLCLKQLRTLLNA